MYMYTTYEKALENFAQKHVVTALTSKVLKRVIYLFGQNRAKRSLRRLALEKITTSGKGMVLTKMQNICLLLGIKENHKNVNTVERLVQVKLMIGLILTTNIQGILKTIYACVGLVIENMIRRIINIEVDGIIYA